MLEVLRAPHQPPSGKMLKPDVGRAVKEDYERLDKFRRWDGGFARSENFDGRVTVACLPDFGETIHPSSKRKQAIAEEDLILLFNTGSPRKLALPVSVQFCLHCFLCIINTSRIMKVRQTGQSDRYRTCVRMCEKALAPRRSPLLVNVVRSSNHQGR